MKASNLSLLFNMQNTFNKTFTKFFYNEHNWNHEN